MTTKTGKGGGRKSTGAGAKAPAPRQVKTDAQKELAAAKDKKYHLTGVLERFAPEMLPMLVGEWQFAKWLKPARFWRTDWVILADPNWATLGIAPPTNQGIVGVAIEIDGGQWAARGGRHNTDADRWKTNTYAELGYLLLRFSPDQLQDNPFRCIAQIRAACKMAGIHLPPPQERIDN